MFEHLRAWAVALPPALAEDARDLWMTVAVATRPPAPPVAEAAEALPLQTQVEVAPRSPEHVEPANGSNVAEVAGGPVTWLSKREVAEHLRVSISSINRHMRLGLPSRLVGGARRYRLDEVEAWIEAQQDQWEADDRDLDPMTQAGSDRRPSDAV